MISCYHFKQMRPGAVSYIGGHSKPFCALHINRGSHCYRRQQKLQGFQPVWGLPKKKTKVIDHLLPLHVPVCVRMPVLAQQSKLLGHFVAAGDCTSWAHPYKARGSHRTESGSCGLPAASSRQNTSPIRRFLEQEREGWFTKQVKTFHCTWTFFFCGERQAILMFIISFSYCYCTGLM